MNRKNIFIVLCLIISLPVLLVIGAFVTEYAPADIESAEVQEASQASALKVGDSLRLVSWNVQFCGSRKHHFFYDGGKVVHVPEADVQATTQAVNKALKQIKPDIALLQELDRNSARTHYIDQLQAVAAYRPQLSWAAAPYHRSPYVPAPGHQHMGRVDLSLGILSRFALRNARRLQLALLNEPRWRQMFNLKRALLEVEIPVEGLKYPLHLGVTHLSAFSHGDGTLKRQLDALQAWMDTHPPEQPYVLAGDFNLLPPGDNPERLSKGKQLYKDRENPMAAFVSKNKTLFKDLLKPENRTYLPYGAEQADRKIDYVFVGGPIQIEEKKVLHEYKELSDHLPLQWTMKVGSKP